jgi:hypothetical protein
MLQVKKVILFDAFSFVGYGLCSRMLDEEINVIGVDAEPMENSLEENKMLYVGRNAYFHFIENSKALLNQSLFEKTDAVIYPWFNSTHHNRNEEKEERLQSVFDYCNDSKTKLILISVHDINRIAKDSIEDELDESWYSKINLENSLWEHRKIRTKNIEFLFTFIDFSNKGLAECIQIKSVHKEYIHQNLDS